MASFLDIIAAGSGAGGILGVAGSLLSSGIGILNSYFTQKHEREMFKMQTERDQILANIRQAELAGQLAIAQEEGANAGFIASQQAEASLGSKGVLIRSIVRPLLTAFYTAVHAAIIGYLMWNTNFADLRDDPLFQYTVVFNASMASMMGAWWFGQRQIEKTISWGNSQFGAKLSTSFNANK